MSTSFGALCTDFYVNQKLSLKMDLPQDRETVLHLFDRVRADLPEMSRLKRYSDELTLESPRREGAYNWLALRRQSIRTGQVNPASMTEAYRLHKLTLELTPYFLTISPLDIDALELLWGFDLECKANHHEIIAEALYDGSPLMPLLDAPDAPPTDVQPVIAVSLPGDVPMQAVFEVKARTTHGQVRRDRYRAEAISIYLMLRRTGPMQSIDELPGAIETMRVLGEDLVNDKLIPTLLKPISRVIIGSA